MSDAGGRKARVLEITSYPPPRAGWGVRVEHVRRVLEARGHDCQVLNIGKSRMLEGQDFVTVKGAWDYTRKVAGFLRRGYRVHMHMNGQSPKGFALSFVAEALSLLFGRRAVLTFHAGADQIYFPRERSPRLVPLLKALFRMPRTVICNDDTVKARIAAYGVDPARIRAIPAFSRQYLAYEPVPLPGPQEAFMAAHKPLLASYLLLRPTFHIPTLLEAIKDLTARWPDLGIVMMGSNTTSDDLDPAGVTRKVAELGLEGNVFWCGDLSHDAFLTTLSRADVSVRTYVYDGVCSSVLQALALKVPVVACENPHRPEGVITFRTGDRADLAEKLAYAIEHNGALREGLTVPEVRDTVAEEADLLAAACGVAPDGGGGRS